MGEAYICYCVAPELIYMILSEVILDCESLL